MALVIRVGQSVTVSALTEETEGGWTTEEVGE